MIWTILYTDYIDQCYLYRIYYILLLSENLWGRLRRKMTGIKITRKKQWYLKGSFWYNCHHRYPHIHDEKADPRTNSLIYLHLLSELASTSTTPALKELATGIYKCYSVSRCLEITSSFIWTSRATNAASPSLQTRPNAISGTGNRKESKQKILTMNLF